MGADTVCATMMSGQVELLYDSFDALASPGALQRVLRAQCQVKSVTWAEFTSNLSLHVEHVDRKPSARLALASGISIYIDREIAMTIELSIHSQYTRSTSVGNLGILLMRLPVVGACERDASLNLRVEKTQ